MPNEANQDLNLAILRALHSSDRPIGSWSVYYLLGEQGHTISAPTIGRRLRDLERKRLVSKVTAEGRIITPSGFRVLNEAAHDRRIRSSAEDVLDLLRSNRRKDIIDLLCVRRIIEAEGARLAATHASLKQITRLERIIARHKTSLRSGSLPVEEDVDFHVSLARASRNRFIASTVRLLRSNEALNSAVSAIHAKLGRPLIDHEEMIKALKDRNPSAAQTLMERHLTNMIAEVERYWDEAFRKNSRSRGRLNRQDVILELSTSASARRSRARCKGQQSTAIKCNSLEGN